MASGSELIARATQIGAQLRAQQDQSDARGCYSDEIHRELLEGGFYRILQPRMFRIHFQSQAITPKLRAQLQFGAEVPLPFRAAAPSAPR